MKITLTKTYKFIDKEIKELNLNLESLTFKDMLQAQRMTTPVASITEANLEYLMMLASLSCNLPLEFFFNLNLKDATNVKSYVLLFLNSMDGEIAETQKN